MEIESSRNYLLRTRSRSSKHLSEVLETPREDLVTKYCLSCNDVYNNDCDHELLTQGSAEYPASRDWKSLLYGMMLILVSLTIILDFSWWSLIALYTGGVAIYHFIKFIKMGKYSYEFDENGFSIRINFFSFSANWDENKGLIMWPNVENPRGIGSFVPSNGELVVDINKDNLMSERAKIDYAAIMDFF